MKRRNPYRAKRKNKGGAIGTLAGAGLGSIIPGVGNAVGASIGGAAGTIIGGLFGGKEEKPEIPATVGRVFQASYGFQEGGSLMKKHNEFMPLGIPSVYPLPAQRDATNVALTTPPPPPPKSRGSKSARGIPWGSKGSVTTMMEGGPLSMDIGGRSHEAGGVNLEEFGRPDIEVERGESVLFDEYGQPEYVFSALNMQDKARTFSEEFKRLKEKGDTEAIQKLKKQQEREMGRVNNVTVDDSVRKASYAKYGGSLKNMRDGGALKGGGFDPKKSSMKYGGKVRHLMQTGGVMDPGRAGTRSMLPPNVGGRAFTFMPQGSGPFSMVPPQTPRGVPFMPPGSGPHSMVPPQTPRGVPFMPQGSGPHSMVPPRGPVGTSFMPPGSGPHTMLPAHGQPMPTEGVGNTASRVASGVGRFIGRALGGVGTLLTTPETIGNRGIDKSYLDEVNWATPRKPRMANPRPEDVIMEDELSLSPIGAVASATPASRGGDGMGPYAEEEFTRGPFSSRSIEAENFGTSPGSAVVPQAEVVQAQSRPEMEGGGSGRDLMQTLGSIAPYAADLFNIGVAASMRDPKRPRGVTPAMMDTRVNTTAEEEMLTQQARSILANPNASAGERATALAQLNRATGQVRSDARRASQQIERGNVQSINRAREINQRVGERHSDRVAQARGARASAISGGVRSISDRMERRAYEKRMAEMEPLQLTALMHAMPTADRRAMVQDMMRSLPAGHPTRKRLEQMLRGI